VWNASASSGIALGLWPTIYQVAWERETPIAAQKLEISLGIPRCMLCDSNCYENKIGGWWCPSDTNTLRPCRYPIRRKPQGLRPRDATTAPVVPVVASNVEKRLSPSRCLLCQQRCRGTLYDGVRCPRHFLIWTSYYVHVSKVRPADPHQRGLLRPHRPNDIEG